MTHDQITSALENLEKDGRIRTYFVRVSPAGTVSWVVHFYYGKPRGLGLLKLTHASANAFLAGFEVGSAGVDQKD